MGGLDYINSHGIESYAGQKTVNIAREMNLPVPEHSFTDSLKLLLGDKEIECYYPGPAHSIDNIAVWIPSDKILFAGCIVKSINSPNLGNLSDGDVRSYPSTVKKLITKFKTAKLVIPGHGNAGGIELLTHTLEMAYQTDK